MYALQIRTFMLNSIITIRQTCIRPSPPGLNQSDPQTSFCQQSTGEICSNVIIEDGQTTVVRETSVDSCEPGDWLSVNLVTRRVVYSSVLTACLCSHTHGLTNYCNEPQRSIKMLKAISYICFRA